jgi:AraC family transcriptional regulator
VFHPAGEVHADHFNSSGGHIFRFEIPHFPTGIDSSARAALEAPFSLVGGPVALLATRLYGEFKQRDQYSPLIIEGLALEILGQSSRQSFVRHKSQPRWLRRVEELLRETAIGELTLFRRFHGCTVGEYVRRLRLEYALRELCSSAKPLAQIAAEAGFSDQSYFCRAFKLSTGMSPGRYRDFFGQG